MDDSCPSVSIPWSIVSFVPPKEIPDTFMEFFFENLVSRLYQVSLEVNHPLGFDSQPCTPVINCSDLDEIETRMVFRRVEEEHSELCVVFVVLPSAKSEQFIWMNMGRLHSNVMHVQMMTRENVESEFGGLDLNRVCRNMALMIVDGMKQSLSKSHIYRRMIVKTIKTNVSENSSNKDSDQSQSLETLKEAMERIPLDDLNNAVIIYDLPVLFQDRMELLKAMREGGYEVRELKLFSQLEGHKPMAIVILATFVEMVRFVDEKCPTLEHLTVTPMSGDVSGSCYCMDDVIDELSDVLNKLKVDKTAPVVSAEA